MNTDVSTVDASPAAPTLVQREALRVRLRLVPARAAEILAVILTVAAVVAGAGTFVALWGWGERGPNATATQALLITDVLIVFGLAALVGARLVRLWRAHRTRTAGSRLHIRLVLLFAGIAMTPTILTAMFATIFFTFGVQTWFGDRVKTAVTESAAIAQAYLREHQQAIRADAIGSWVGIRSGLRAPTR